jgi:hypothetical protein
MVAAQAVMYFAPGKQYDKYIRMIAGVMILIQFISPFVNNAAEIELEWEEGMEQMMQKLDGQDYGLSEQAQWENTGTQEAIMEELEETIAARLEQVNENTAYRVWKVTIQLEEKAEENTDFAEAAWELKGIVIVMEKTNASDGKENNPSEMTPVEIEPIVVPSEETEQQTEEEQTYRKLFADTLGVAEERVEVTCRGGW